MKKQILYIHGGETFNTYDEYITFLKEFNVDIDYVTKKRWKHELGDNLGSEYKVIRAEMPNALNAKYIEWEIIFKKYLDKTQDELILIGHSLGGIFLAKYLSENKLNKKLSGVFLVSACFDDSDSSYSLADFVINPDKLSQLDQCTDNLFLYHSKDDEVVKYSDFEKYLKHLPSAKGRTFTDRGHFNVENFPEIIEDIKSIKS